MTDGSIEEINKRMETPAGDILMWAYNLSCDANDILRKQLPQLECYPQQREFGNLLQVGTILATLLRMERYLGENDYSKLHRGITQGIAPSMRNVYIPPLQELACYLLKSDVKTTGFDLPYLNSLLKHEEDELAYDIGYWLVKKLKNAAPTDPFDLKLVSTLGQLVFVMNAQMIASMMLSDKQTINRIV